MNFRDDIQLSVGAMAKDVGDGLGDTVSYVHRDKTAISLTAFPGPERTGIGNDMGLESEEQARSFFVPAQAGLVAEISQKALTDNVATLKTSTAHGFVAGQLIRVRLTTADAVFDGEHIIATVPTTTTLTYAKTNANVSALSVSGVVDGKISIGDRIVYESVWYEISGIESDSVRAGYALDCVRMHAERAGGV